MDLRELEAYRLEDAVKFHPRLNPRIWGPDERMLPEVRERLLAIADDFRESLGIDVEVKDITISGSNAAYTYTPHSDIDLHLVADLPEADSSEVYRELFDAKKYQYNDEHDYKIGGADVELYVQDANKPHYSQGIYSIKDDRWLSVPKRRRPEIDDISVESKYQDIGQRIDQAIESGDLARMDRMAEKIRAMRQSGLEETGEFGPENLAFKILRNNGTLQRLRTARQEAKSREMSLNERRKKKRGSRKKWGVFGGYYYPGFGYYGSGEASGEGGGGDGGGESTIKENTQQDQQQIIERFARRCCDLLGMDQPPRIRLRRDPEWTKRNGTFGRYTASPEHQIELAVHGRHIIDILRTLAHEMTHARQNETTGLPDDAGETGSRYEDQANAMAGRIMRHWAEAEPELFQGIDLDEDRDSGDFPNQSGGKMPGQPIPFPKGTVKVDVSDVYDWYKLGQHISDLRGLGQHDFGKGPPQTVLSFGSEPLEHEYIQDLAKIGLKTHDIDEGLRGRLGAAAAAACIAGTPGCATTDITATDALRGAQAVGRAVQATKPYGTASRSDVIRAGAEEELRQELKNLLRRGTGTGDQSRVREADEPVMKLDDPIVNYDVPYSAIARPERLHQVRRFGRISHYGSPTASAAIISVPVSKEPQFQATMRNLSIPVKKSQVYEASGYIPTAKEKNDPRYKMALTVDVKPGETGRQANKLGLKTDSQGRPQLLMKRLANMLEETKLDEKCWTGYRRQGMKRKGGRMVPNCVPVEEGMGDLDPFTRNVLNRMKDDSWLSAEHAYFITKGIQKKNQTNPEAYNQEIQRFVHLYKQYKGQQAVAEGSGFDQEAGIGIDGQSFKFKIRDLVDLAKNYPVTKVDPKQFSDQIAGREEDPAQSAARAEQADLQYPIIVVKRANGQLWIADGTHRAHKAILNKLPSINAKIIPIKDMAPFSTKQGVAEDFDGSREYRGLVMSVAEGEDGFKLTAHSPAGKKLGFVEFSYDTDGMIWAEELEVDERYRGQGIAQTMYDYAKSLGFTVRRSSEQTPDGAAFWDKNRPGEKIWEHALTEGVNDYLWHGSRNEHKILYPRQANDTGGKEESNKNAIYATPNAKVAIAMGLTTPGSDTGMFPNDPQMVLFKGGIRKGQMVYLHKVPKDLFIKHNGREWYSKPDVTEIKPLEVKAIPVDKYLNLIRQATPQDLELQKKYTKQGVAEDQDLFEVKMSPTALEQWAKSPEAAGIQAGFEAEMIFRDAGEEQSEYDRDDNDQRAYSIEDVVDFFQDGENGIGRNAANRLRDGLSEEWIDWREEAIQAAWENDEEDNVLKWMEENVWEEDQDLYRARATEALGIDTAELSPEQTEAIERQAREEFERDVRTTIDDQDEDYQRAREAFRDDAADNDPDYDEEAFLQDRYPYMTDIADHWDLEWPYLTSSSGRTTEDIARDLSQALGGARVVPGTHYKSVTRRPGQWIVEGDGSIEPDDESTELGQEIVSPPMPLPDALRALRTVIDWANGPGDAYTNGSTGLHMGVSIPYKGGAIDYVKLVLFSGDEYVLDQFRDTTRDYAQSALEKLKDVQRSRRRRMREAEDSMAGAEKTAAAMDLMKKNLIELAQRYVQDGVGLKKGSGEYPSILVKNGYIEFRSPGGDYLSLDSRDESALATTMLRFARAMQIAGRPDLERREYSKKLYKLLSGFRSAEMKKTRRDTRYRTEIETEGDNDALELFAQYSAGMISPAQLKKEWAQRVLAKEQPRPQAGDKFEIYRTDTGEVLDVITGRDEGEIGVEIARAVERFSGQGFDFKIRKQGEREEEPSRRVKVAKRIQQTPAQAADDRRDSAELQQRVTGEFPYRVMWSENGREDILNTTARSAEAAEENLRHVLDAMGRRPDPGSIRAVPRPVPGYQQGLSQQDQPQATAGRTDWQEYQIYDANTRETVVGFMAQDDDEALARLERHRASRPGRQFGIRVAHSPPRQSAPAQPRGEWTGRWLIKTSDGQVIHTFAGIGNVQSDANRHAARWLDTNRPELENLEIEVVPEMV